MKTYNLINITILLLSFLFFPSAFSQQLANNKKTELKSVSDRTIESLDMLLVHVFGEPEFSGPDNAGLKLRVSSAGEVSLYLLGTIKVAGKTPSEAEKHIRSLLMKEYIRDPHVLVQVETYRVTNVTVMGQVSKPGVVPLPAEQRIDILAGIAIAGGFTKLARTSRIDLTRDGETTTFDLDKLKKEKDVSKKVWLKTGDLVYVHESAF
jgi:polysaccharide export outer membrane protein